MRHCNLRGGAGVNVSMDIQSAIVLVCLAGGASIGAAAIFVIASMRSSQMSRDEEDS